jgi:hypothetical protein
MGYGEKKPVREGSRLELSLLCPNGQSIKLTAAKIGPQEQRYADRISNPNIRQLVFHELF